MRVGSSSLANSGLNPHDTDVNRSSAGAASFVSVGMGSRAVGSQAFIPGVGSGAFSSQSSTPPLPTASSRWWEDAAGGNTLIPGVGVGEPGEKLGRSPFKVPKAPAFDGSEVAYPPWSQ